jgi:adenylate cyclase
LGEYFEEMTAVLRAHGGTIDKFMGDGIMAFFNAPRDLEDHAGAACRAALACRRRLAELSERWVREGKPPLRARIGMHTGSVLVGNIGAPERFAYTAMGDVVNLASRLESLNKLYGTGILASEATRAAAGGGFAWRTVDRVAVLGRASPTDVSELLAPADGLRPEADAARLAYETAFDRYLARDFAEAHALFRVAAAARPDDRAAPLLGARCEEFLRHPPPAAWTGAQALTEK